MTLHLIPAARWEAWRATPDPAAPVHALGFDTEGFVHCTDGDAEMLAVANRFYAGDPGAFVVLDLDLALVGAPWRYDDPGRVYPHVYGPLRRDAVRGSGRSSGTPRGASWATGSAGRSDADPPGPARRTASPGRARRPRL